MQPKPIVRPPATPVPEIFFWQTVDNKFAELLNENVTANNAEIWLEDWSELEKELLEAHVTAYNATTEDTLNEKAKASYLHFVREIIPNWDMASEALIKKALGLAEVLPMGQLQQVWRRWQNKTQIYRQENVSLQAQDTELAKQFDVVRGKQTVVWEGQEQTLNQLEAQYSEHPDRNLREQAYHLVANRKLQDAPYLGEVFLKLHALRLEMAMNAGFQDYREFIWRKRGRFDYTPADTMQFAESIRKHIVPLLRRVCEARRKKLGVEALRPWDLNVSTEARAARKPFQDATEFEKKFVKVFANMDAEFANMYQQLRQRQGLELPVRPGKAEGNIYSWEYPKTKRAYVYMNVVGSHTDLVLMLHECGHAFHSLLSLSTQPLFWNNTVPVEFAEVASQSLELLGIPYLASQHGGFYNSEDSHQLLGEAMVDVLYLLVGKARREELLQWLYTQPTQTLNHSMIDAKQVEIYKRFDVGVNIDGIEKEMGIDWQRSTVFKDPFYNIEYAIAWFGALQIWQNSLQDERHALAQYKNALRLGGSRSLAELFKAAGAKFAFDDATIADVAALIEKNITQLL